MTRAIVLMGLARQRAVTALRAAVRCRNLADDTPEPAEEALHALDTGLGVHSMSWSAGPMNRIDSARRVGSVGRDELVRRLRAPAALRDLRAALRDEAVAEEALERLAVCDQPEVVSTFMK